MYGYGYSYPNNTQGSGLMGNFEARVNVDGGSVVNQPLTGSFLGAISSQGLSQSLVLAALPAYKTTGALVDKWYDINANDGTGVTTTRPSLVGFSPDFDGTDDRIGFAHNANQLLTGGGTIGFWIKADTAGVSNLGRVLSKDSAYQVTMLSTGAVQIQIAGGAFVSSGAGSLSYPMASFDQFCVVFTDAGLCTWYKNGVQIGTPASSNAATLITGTNTLFFADLSSSTRAYDGGMSLPFVFNSQLTATQILSIYTQTAPFFV